MTSYREFLTIPKHSLEQNSYGAYLEESISFGRNMKVSVQYVYLYIYTSVSAYWSVYLFTLITWNSCIKMQIVPNLYISVQSFKNRVLFPEAAVCNNTCPPMAPTLQGCWGGSRGLAAPLPPHSAPAEGNGMCQCCYRVTDAWVGRDAVTKE